MISHNAARQSAVKLISWHLSTAAHEGLPCESDIMFNQTVNFDIHLLRLVTHSPYQAFDWHIDRDIYIKLTKVVTSSIDLKPSGKPEKPDIWKSRRNSRLVHSVRYIFPKRKDDTHKPSVIHVTTNHARHGPCCRPFKKSQNRRGCLTPVWSHIPCHPISAISDISPAVKSDLHPALTNWRALQRYAYLAICWFYHSEISTWSWP